MPRSANSLYFQTTLLCKPIKMNERNEPAQARLRRARSGQNDSKRWKYIEVGHSK